MPNAAISLQDRDAAAKRYAAYNEQAQAYNASEQAAANLYNEQAAAYNAFVNQVKGGGYAAAKNADGSWFAVKGKNGEIAPAYLNKDGSPGGSVGRYDSVEVGGAAADSYGSGAFWLNNPDGTMTMYGRAWSEDGTSTWAPTPGLTMRPLEEFGQKPPVPGPTPDQPKPWNPSLGEIREINNPTANTAQADAARGVGVAVKTGLANESVERGSAFADPEDPNNLKDAGILARVLGGQL